MILVDTSIWVDHFRGVDAELVRIIKQDRLLCHPFVIGEIVLGNMRERRITLALLNDQRQCTMATDLEVQKFIDRYELFGLGIGYIDAHLLASTLLHKGSALWTRDKKLQKAAEKAGASLHVPPIPIH